jgi:ubiquinone/menaquinone biosynthesis C-methylase UbiE
MRNKKTYIPALRFHWLTPFYDAVMSATMSGPVFKRRLIDLAQVDDSAHVLDLGCGTGTLAILLKALHPNVRVHALDGDRTILKTARHKAEAARVTVQFDEAMAYALPYGAGTFDRVLTSLLLHHLTTQQKEQTLRETYGVLRTGGEVHIADWGTPANAVMRACFCAVQLIDGFETTADHVGGRLPAMITAAGFERVTETGRQNTPLGTLYFYRGVRP